MGQPVAGNPTQFMMERAFQAAGLDWCCLTLEVSPENLGDAVRGVRAMGFKGANVTIPHKVAVIEYLDSLTESAALMGAANCIYRAEDKLVGENTDGKGFVQSLRTVSDPAGKKIVLLGAGGVARAIAVALGTAGAGHITVVNRTRERGEALADLLNEKAGTSARFIAWEEELAVPEDAEILINATSVGVLDPEMPLPLKLDTLKPPLVVADVVFNPPCTWLLQEARQRGCTTLNGLGMLVNQAALDFEIWTGRQPDAAIMREAVEEFLEI
ncbi:MAG: shikimate dehydrogenase [Planctomycetes bacterium]|nr:shikimate dehydrogenase [Planctomycetota bacterium]